MCNGIRFFSIRITSYPLKKQILTTADLASSTCNKTQQYLSILLIPTERRAYNTSSFLYPNTVLTAFGNSRQYTGSSESKDGTHTDAAAVLTVPVTAHATIGLHVPVPCEEFRVLRRRPKPPTASKIILAVCGLFFALLAIKYSFLKAVFIFLCIGLGIWLGRFLDKKTNIRKSVEDFFRND